MQAKQLTFLEQEVSSGRLHVPTVQASLIFRIDIEECHYFSVSIIVALGPSHKPC